jgi:hypothetical protein
MYVCGVLQVKTLDAILETFAEIVEEWVESNAHFHPNGIGEGWYLPGGNEGVLVVVGLTACVQGKREGVTGPARKRVAFVTPILFRLQVLVTVGVDIRPTFCGLPSLFL